MPVSATLQLNADLAAGSREWLTQLAAAERQRLEAAAPKSYLYRVEPRAAVLAADAGQLAAFVETYGGLLELVPVLQSAPFSPESEFVVAEEVRLEAAGGEYRLRCTCRVPIDREKCTWCRACIAACEPGCISPGLEIDFGLCTLGGSCAAACPAGAIDLYAREEKEFVVPAVILLGEPAVELPAAREMIFAAADREKFFRQVGEHQVEETVAWTRELCQYSGRLNLGCRRCQEACTAGALTCGADGVVIDYLACRDCGACVAACPTGALQDQRFNDRQFIDFFADLPLAGKTVLVVGTAAQLQQLWWRHADRCWESAFFLEYPQPGGLTAMHYLFL
ncbi:MAG: 4Fe-4S binding protein, partial [Deltaproteobacteria bacterium]|nr:4Fe-4S binding protein [Deltaproteobacteria bacterium]